jgi:small subunit ribosomal protein S5
MADLRKKKIEEEAVPELIDRVVYVHRCAKVVKGGRRFSFSSLVVVGDNDGQVGYGLGKANEVAESIRKGIEAAKKSMVQVPRAGSTIPHEIIGRYGAARILLKPAPPGTGIVAGGGVRVALELSGIDDVYAKALGSRNPLNLIRAGMNGLSRISQQRESFRIRRKVKDGGKGGIK